MNPLDQYYLKEKEPNKSVFLALRAKILSLDENITESLKYGMPFFEYKQKMFCYFWKEKNTNLPYVGIVEGHRIKHPLLEQGNRKRMKIFKIDPTKDLPFDTLEEILNAAKTFY